MLLSCCKTLSLSFFCLTLLYISLTKKKGPLYKKFFILDLSDAQITGLACWDIQKLLFLDLEVQMLETTSLSLLIVI